MKELSKLIKYYVKECKESEGRALIRIMRNMDCIPSHSWDFNDSTIDESIKQYVGYYSEEDPDLLVWMRKNE